MIARWLGYLRRRWRPTPIADGLWRDTLDLYPFLAQRPTADLEKLRALSEIFLSQKQFHGTHGLVVTDAMAVAIAAQACVPILHWGLPRQALAWYGDFVGIVVHADTMLAKREVVDAAGVVHRYHEPLAGEAMDGGPVTLNWKDVATAGTQAAHGMNLVIHEFAHKIDMRSGTAGGCPPLPPNFMGTASTSAAQRRWLAVIQPAFDSLREANVLAERFGQPRPWLDAYATTSLAEFFAVACEAYFANRQRFGEEFAALAAMFDDYFNPVKGPVTARPPISGVR